MTTVAKYKIKETSNLSPRVKWLRDYFFEGVNRKWNNELVSFSNGEEWDIVHEESHFYVAPEMYGLIQLGSVCLKQMSKKVDLPNGFWEKTLPERRAWFVDEVMVNRMPQELLPGDLIAGARFLIMASKCLDKKQTKDRSKAFEGKKGMRAVLLEYHDRGYGNFGSISGHIIPGYENVLKNGFKAIYKDLEDRYNRLPEKDKKGKKGGQLRAMMTSAKMPKKVAEKYADLCNELAEKETDEQRKSELLEMGKNLRKVPWEGASSFWEAVQSLWITHMLVMSDEGYTGAGLSFGRVDQYLLPFWRRSIGNGMSREFGKEILGCFFMHCNSVYDAMIKTGNNQGITSSFGQIINLSGVGKNGKDMTNELTYVFLEVIDEMNPILEPKPNVRLHRNSPDELLDKLIDMVSTCQGAPFILNFDERSMAGLMREAKMSGMEHLINEDTVYDYGTVGCIENTMVGNDRSNTVDNNVNLLKGVELALNDGKDLIPYVNATGKEYPGKQEGPKTGDPRDFKTFEEFYTAFEKQIKAIIKKFVGFYTVTENARAKYGPTPYLSCLVKGCAESCKDITEGGAELKYITLEGGTFGTTVDSILAIKYLVFDEKECTMDELVKALRDNWKGHEVLQAKAINKAPKYGRDDDEADELGKRIMDTWADEVWKYKVESTGVQYRGGMLSWNYWIADSCILAASADGREKGKFLSNAICPSNGADINGPTSNANSVGKVLGGKASDYGDYKGYLNCLPNGASHTITFNPSLLRDAEHRSKFRAFLRGYIENGGTALQINMIDADMLKDAQKHPENYRHLLVRVTGYSAYFATIGREIQNEIIARETHSRL